MSATKHPRHSKQSDEPAWFGYRISEWSEMTGTSRVTTWRNVKRGDLKLVYVGPTPIVPRSEAIRLGFITS
ncbi:MULTISPECIES: hypothetical protein [unclassified Bradyrhizobium]|uniref:hypothetical protein n=1 Tax=unclassified Bradyrhizobium TaxID=2631580 RepID=UPI001FF95220|nr:MULTISPECIES: hypothetical protein [unclassified Bradyrhizobium]MCK1708586.1 hypothetical protein [Bradyrhizobium sp. 143]MCK1731173.1 hypothetical protein [Bradyrhizobium sp. 142]